MKIVLLGPAYPYRGGIAQFNGVLASALERAGHEVALVNFRKQFPRILFPGKTQYDESAPPLSLPSERTFVAWNPWSWRRTAREIERHQPDLILVMWWMPFFGPGYFGVARCLSRAYRKRLLYVLHNVVPHERRPGDRFLSKLALGTARFFVPLSRGEEKQLRRMFPDLASNRVKFSPHPLYDCYRRFDGDQAAARRTLEISAEWLLLFFGFIREYKGLDVLLRAMPAIRERVAGVKLAVVGEFYQDRKTYDDLIRDLDIADSVLIRDQYVSGDDVGVYFAAADSVVLPYRSATQSGIAQIAYALGTPVITTDVGGMSEVVRDGVSGYVVPPENPAALADAVTRFFAAGGRSALEAGVRAEAQRYTWERMVEVIESFMESM